MAITILDNPYPLTPLRQRLMIVASSTNVAESGFKYKATVTLTTLVGPIVVTLYIAPNISDKLILDLSQLTRLRNYEINGDGGPFHFGIDSFPEKESYGIQSFSVSLLEAWIVSGVLTDDPDTDGPEVAEFAVFNARFEFKDGYKPSLSGFVYDGDNKRILSDRLYTTQKFVNAEKLGLPIDDTAIYIQSLETDYGMMSFLGEMDLSELSNIVITTCDSSGTLHSISFPATVTEFVMHYPLYPASINDAQINFPTWPAPQDYPNWKYISIQGVDDGAAPVTAKYIMYNAEVVSECDCNYDRVRVAWVNSRGGWDYQNFIKKSEVTHSLDRKNYRKNVGVYSGNEFSFNNWDRQIVNRENIDSKSIKITSDWISEGGFEFLKSLLLSTQVHIVTDDGYQIPCQVATSEYTEKKERNGKLFNLELNLIYSQGQI